MKKLLFLFTALLLISCSSEDEESVTTFLEKYDGYIFESIDEEGDEIDISRIQFINEGKKIKNTSTTFIEGSCFEYLLDQTYDYMDGTFEMTVLENTVDLLKIRTKQIDNTLDPTHPDYITLGEGDFQIDGNRLTITFYNDNSLVNGGVEEFDGEYDTAETEYWSKSDISASDICNL